MNLNIMTAEDATKLAAAVKNTSKEPQQIATEGQAAAPGKKPQVTGDDVYTQIVKYIPSPLIGLYLLIVNTLVGSIDDKHLHAKQLWSGVTFVVFMILVACFLRTRGVHRLSQIGISMLAFFAFATASPGFFELINGYPAWIGTIALAMVLAIIAAFRVKPLPDGVIDASAP